MLARAVGICVGAECRCLRRGPAGLSIYITSSPPGGDGLVVLQRHAQVGQAWHSHFELCQREPCCWSDG